MRARNTLGTVVILFATVIATLIGPLSTIPRAYAAFSCTSSGHTDDFSGSSLSMPPWTANHFVSGAAYSVNSGCLNVSVPSTSQFDSWTGFDNAPEIERTDMGANSWTIETHMNLVSATSPITPTFQTGLMVRFGSYDNLFWGLYRSGDMTSPGLRLDRSGVSGLVKRIWYDNPSVYLQIQKTGAIYTFLHKANATDKWIIDGAYTPPTTTSVTSVGLFIKTFPPFLGSTQGTAVSMNFDYFDLFKSAATSTDCSTVMGTSNAQSWGNVWANYIPLHGPVLALDALAPNPLPGHTTTTAGDAVNSCERLYVPPDQTYDLSGGTPMVDNAPQRQRTDFGGGDWTTETELNLALSDGHGTPHSQAGLMVSFSRYDALIWGIQDGGLVMLRTTNTSTSLISVTSYTSPQVFLCIKKTAATNSYTFLYAASKPPTSCAIGTGWTTATLVGGGTTYTAPDPVQYVGIVGRTFGASPTELIADFNYFTLTRVPATPGAICTSINHSSDFTGDIDSAWMAQNVASGATITSTTNLGCARFSIPNTTTFNDNLTADNAPKLVRSDIGTADWTIETKVTLVISTTEPFQSGIMVRFAPLDQYLFGLTYNGATSGLKLVHTLDGSGPAILGTSATVMYLQVVKTGTSYAFSYKTPGNLNWLLYTTQTYAGTVSDVGLVSRTYAMPQALVSDFDYFNLTVTDNFSGASLNGAWTQYIPSSGPAWNLTGTGAVELTIPATKIYNHWSSVDNAPQLQRAVFPNSSSGWDMQTEATMVVTPTANFLAGLMVYFSQYNLLYWGLYPDSNGLSIRLTHTGDLSPTIPDILLHSSTVWLRIIRIGNYYLFYHKIAATNPWLYDGNAGPFTNTVPTVGYIGKTTAKVAVTVDFSNFNFTPIPGN